MDHPKQGPSLSLSTRCALGTSLDGPGRDSPTRECASDVAEVFDERPHHLATNAKMVTVGILVSRTPQGVLC